MRLAVCLAVLCGPGAGGAGARFGLYFDLRDLDGTNAKRFMGENRWSCTGARSVVGDLNGDGLLDLIIGAACPGFVGEPDADNLPGTVYVVFGGPAFDQVVTMGVEELDGTNGFAIEGPEPAAFFGEAIVSGFDWNADGIDDLAAGAPLATVGSNNNAGRVFVVFGHPDIGATGSFDLTSLDGTNGFVANGIGVYDAAGAALANAGDLNDDGFDDLAIGAPNADPKGRIDAGQSYVIFGDFGVYGQVDRPEIPLWDVGGVYVIFGRSLFALGDFDRDGDVDLDDFGVFGACYNGAARPPAPTCPKGIDTDLDNDGDCDLDDFGLFSACYNGAENPPAPACPWDECDGAGGEGAMGPGGPDLDGADEPTPEELYWLLYEYCEENGIPFT